MVATPCTTSSANVRQVGLPQLPQSNPGSSLYMVSIRSIFRTKTRAEWTNIFSKLDACVQPVMDLQEALLEDPQIRSRGMVVDVDMPLHDGTKVKQMATSIDLSETPCEYRFAGYPLGWHTKEIIASLGLDYDDLQAKGVFD